MTRTLHLAELNVGRLLAAHLCFALALAGCASTAQAPISETPEETGNYEVTGAVYHAEFFEGARYIGQERDENGQLKLVNGQPVPLEIVFHDGAGVNPKIVVSRQDGAPMGVESEAAALKVAALLCADKGRRPMTREGPYKIPGPATSVYEDGKWGVFNLCR